MAIEPEGFRDLLAGSPEAALAMLETVTRRLRRTEASLVEQGRLAGLGSLAAGLAHELNNPASALLRSSDLLRGALPDWGRRCADLRRLPSGTVRAGAVKEMEERFFRPEGSGVPRQSSQEEELEEWMEDEGLDDAWDLAAPLADAGWDRAALEALTEAMAPDHRRPFIRWIAAGAEVYGLVDEIRNASRAISSIVGSVRSYSQLDRSPIQMVDLGESISDTLMILKGKLRNGIEVVRDIPPDLPRIEAYGGELNQVWTNLIDNALDAMEGEGTLEIKARPTGGGVMVRFSDSGSGIPSDVRPNIFDPFFTTKPQGSGTGLGLAISYGIVVNRHGGAIQVESRPGHTVVEVSLPQRLRQEVS